MTILTIILSTLSLVAVLLAIVFEGMLKKEVQIKPSFQSFYTEVNKLSLFGWTLIIISIILGFGNGFNSIKTIDDNKQQYVEDTLRLHEIIEQLRTKKIIDSIKIEHLENILKVNGLKSDSIRLVVVDNAVRSLAAQQKAIEKERQNIFIHMQNEVEENLRKILMNFNEEHILGFSDTNLFISTRLNNNYIKKYEIISENKTIIDFFMETSEKIDAVNRYADLATETKDKTLKKLNIRMFLTNVKSVRPDLFSIYKRVLNLKSYKEYEALDFHPDTSLMDESGLEELVIIQHLLRENMLKIR